MKPEILAPGGSLDHGLWALEGGADAVYVGFQKFSARSHADNLSLDDMAALTAAAHAKGAKIYCALNTVLTTEETAEAVSLAWQLFWRGVSAFIVQDLGLAHALVTHGPPVPLHASTQAAVHTPGGVAALKAQGFQRIVLARELTMAEIGAIVDADPTMEYEVFVHGALCYAVSGNCMASGLMLGRSANRGDCGQVCRTKFELDYLIPGPRRRVSPHEDGQTDVHAPPGEETWKPGTVGAFASMNDLELGPRIRELRDRGVLSFKIEGRMKPPAYAYNTARAYRAFLDGGRDQEAWAWLDEARLRFGRLPSPGWFDGHKALAQTNPGWASSLGMPLGTAEALTPHGLVIGTGDRTGVLRTLGRGDGVMVLGRSPGQSYRGALAGPAEVSRGQTTLPLADPVPFAVSGASVWLLSRHDGKLPVKKAGRPWRHALPIAIALEAPATGEPARLVVSTPEFGGVTLAESLAVEPARGQGSLEASLREVFTASDSAFGPGEFAVAVPGAWFAPPRVLKEVRRRWYALVEARAEAWAGSVLERLKTEAEAWPPRAPVPPRAELSPREGVNRLLGFVTEWERLTADQLAPTPWGLALPLAPFTPQEEGYFGRLEGFLARLRAEAPDQKVFLGLNNPAHLTWLGRLRAQGLGVDSWFADWAFHTANPWAHRALAQAAPGFAFAVGWLEDPGHADHSYAPPLFTSRACMLRNSFGDQASLVPTADARGFDSRPWTEAKLAGQSAPRPAQGPRCPDGCAGHFSARLVQGKRPFRVEARDCINYLIAEE